MQEYPTNLNKSFGEYVHHIMDENPPINQHCWVYDGNGKRIIDYIGRFENIEHDFKHITKLILGEQLQLSHLNRSGRKESYSSYYDDELQQIVYEKNKKDFELFGYKRDINDESYCDEKDIPAFNQI